MEGEYVAIEFCFDYKVSDQYPDIPFHAMFYRRESKETYGYEYASEAVTNMLDDNAQGIFIDRRARHNPSPLATIVPLCNGYTTLAMEEEGEEWYIEGTRAYALHRADYWSYEALKKMDLLSLLNKGDVLYFLIKRTVGYGKPEDVCSVTDLGDGKYSIRT